MKNNFTKNVDSKRNQCKTNFLSGLMIYLSVTVFCLNVNAQVTGTKIIGIDYATLAACISDLNTNGVSGNVIVNVPAGYSETAPAGGFVLGSATLNATLSLSSTLTIHKSGSGANPLLTAFTPGTTTNSDGIFKLNGADYVTIDGINLTEDYVNNTTATQMMEWGYALVRYSGTDGSQNNTIQNCTITLSKTNFGTGGTAGSHGIFSGSVTTTNAAVTVTATSGANSNNQFYSNSISNCNIGIYLSGFAAVSPWSLYDLNNNIGGASAATGNQVTNFGSSATTTAVYGIYLVNQNNSNVSFNTLDNASGGSGLITNGDGYGIIHDLSVNTVFTANNNTVTMTRTSGGAAATGSTQCITSFGGNTGSTTGSITINNNTVRVVCGSTLTLAGNTILLINTNTTANTGALNSIVNINNNNLNNTIGNNTLANFNLIQANDLSTNKTISGNFTSGTIGRTVNSNSSFRGITATNAGVLSGTHTFNNNNISNISVVYNTTPAGALLGISAQSGSTSGSGNGPDIIMTNNTVSNLSTTGATPVSGTAIGSIQGISVVNGKNNQISGNTVSNISSTAGAALGILAGSSGGSTTSTLSLSVFNNTISGLSSGLGGFIACIGIQHQHSSTTSNIYKNKIYDISVNSGIVGGAAGIFNTNSVIATSTTNIYNNFIGRIYSPSANFLNAVVGISNSFTSTLTTNLINAYYNTIYLDGTATSGGTACYYAANANGTVTLINNIFINNATSAITGALIRNTTSVVGYGSTSNNNILYANPSSGGYLLYAGGLTYSTLAAYQAFVTPRDNLSRTENTPFLNTSTGASSNYLHINPAIPTQAESNAVNIATYTDDFDGDIRQGNGGYAGTGTAPDIGADEGNFIPQQALDATVTNVYTLGKLPLGYGAPHVITARISSVGYSTMTSVSVTLTISGANSFTNTQTIASLAPGGSSIVTFAGYSPTVAGSNTITVEVGSDNNNTNNSMATSQLTTSNLYSYKDPSASNAGGVGFNGATGDFVGKFFSANNYGNSDTINEIQVDFSAGGQPYQIGIWDNTGVGGTPGTNLWTSSTLTSATGVAFISVPNIPVSGTFYTGVRQTGTANVSFAFQFESPVRSSSFYYTSPTGNTSWTDFLTTSSPFRFALAVQLFIPTPPSCAIGISPASGTNICFTGPVTLNWGSGGGGPTGYDVYLSNNLSDITGLVAGAKVASNIAATTFTTSSLITGQYYWTVIAKNPYGDAAGCSVQDFTVANTPSVTITANPSNATICGTGSVSLSASGANSFVWSPATGLNAVVGANVISSTATGLIQTTQYTVTGTTFGCTGTATQVVTLAPVVSVAPTANISIGCNPLSTILHANASTTFTYCIPTTTNGGTSADAITDFVSAGLGYNYSTTTQVLSPGYLDLTSIIGNGSAGSTYAFSLTQQDPSDQIMIWCDFNNDGSFNGANELLFSQPTGSGAVSGSLTIPFGVVSGNHRLRIRNNYLALPTGTCSTDQAFGETKDFTLNVTGGIDPFTYLWTPSGNLNNPGIADPSVAGLTSNQTYNVAVTSALGCSANGSVGLSLYPQSAAPIITPNGSTTFCDGNSVTLTSSAASANQWSSGETTSSINVNSSGSYNVYYVDNNNCNSLTSNDVVVTVNPNPGAPGITVYGTTTFCANQNGFVELEATNGYSEYHWSNGATTALISVAVSGTYNVYVKDINNCVSPASSDVVTTANQCCVVPFGLIPSNITTISATLSWDASVSADSFLLRYNPFGTTQYDWVSIIGSNSTTLQNMLHPNTTYQWRVRSKCGGTSTGYQSQDSTFTTLDGQAPCIVPYGFSSTVTTTSATVCWENRVTADYWVVRLNELGSAVYSYQTLTGGANIVGPHCASFSGLKPNTTYEFKVRGVCGSLSTGYNFIAYPFTTINGPAPCIIPFGLSSTHVSTTSETVQWDNHVTGDSFLVRYTVIGSAVLKYKHLSSGSSSTLLTGLIPNTDYQWWVKDYCGGTSTGYNSSPATFKTLASRLANPAASNFQQLSVYPNPARTQVTVSYNSNEIGGYQIKVTDLTGRTLLSVEATSSIGENKQVINLSSLAKGLYLMHVESGQNKQLTKLVVE